jgi:kumamolisin
MRRIWRTISSGTTALIPLLDEDPTPQILEFTHPVKSWGVILLFLLILAGGATVTRAQASVPPSSPHTPALPLPPLALAERQASDLGPLPGSTPITFTLTLRDRNASALQILLAGGGQLTPAQWNSTYGPDPAQVGGLRATLARAGLSSTWRRGESLLSVTGVAGSVEHFLQISLDRFVLHDGTRFYASFAQPSLPKSMARTVTAVTGLDDYPSHLTSAIVHPEAGVSPAEISKFYNLSPLRAAGLDGTGTTVTFVEAAPPPTSSLRAYALKFHLPRFDIITHTDPARWGRPDSRNSSYYADDAGEEALDLEVVHGLAPGAREVVYEFGDESKIPDMIQAMIAANPGAILSSSYSMADCEQSPGGRNDALALNAVFAHAAAMGTTIFFASGDRGAYSCLPDGDTSTEGRLSVDPDVDSPYITGVGGTSAFFAANGAYFKEAAWGEPLETWGSGGGVSTIFKQPSYQVAPGLGPKSLGGRGVPDVSCDADFTVSGWDVFEPPYQGESGPQEVDDGGTSAAAPCWAAITALIDEDLTHQSLAPVGFANPALYDFSRDPGGLPAKPFHTVTEGSNLHFVATAGWNAATGLGSPDVANLADDFEWYDRNRPASR